MIVACNTPLSAFQNISNQTCIPIKSQLHDTKLYVVDEKIMGKANRLYIYTDSSSMFIT